ncbi:MAG: DUF5654 family protein [Patescibacteria group bacterium]|nr:DUF5654 family protein [Patescibacteria group bacterium]MDD5716001.1 DUF5654 family protein [Patescibacteria group bacterium]
MGKQYLQTMVSLATTAFGLVAALAWNGAITELFKAVFGKTSGVVSMFVYAIVVTVVVVTITAKLGKIAERAGVAKEQGK